MCRWALVKRQLDQGGSSSRTVPVAIIVVLETESLRLSEDPLPEGRRAEEMCFSALQQQLIKD